MAIGGINLKKIESSQNQHYQWAKRAASGKVDNLVVAEGPKLFYEALASGLRPEAIFLEDGAFDQQALSPEYADVTFGVSTRLFRGLAKVESPQSIIGFFEFRPPATHSLYQSDTVLVFDKIQDPGNLGTILRTAEALDAGGVILTRGSCSPLNDKAVRASMGSIFRLPVVFATDLKEAFVGLKKNGFKLAATVLSGRPIWDIGRFEKVAMIFGTEGTGLDTNLVQQCDFSVTIPMKKTVESLNVSISAALCMYERMRSRLDPLA